jgi:hypothetical protein
MGTFFWEMQGGFTRISPITTDFSLNSERRSLTTDYTDGTDEEETCKNIREIRVIRG